jgi:hypothetical protein
MKFVKVIAGFPETRSTFKVSIYDAFSEGVRK